MFVGSSGFDESQVETCLLERLWRRGGAAAVQRSVQRMGRKKGKRHARSLSSRKRLKDVSTAIPDDYGRFASDKFLADPPKKDMDAKLPRKLMMMQHAIARMHQIEAGEKPRPPRWSQPDGPRPEQPHTKVKKQQRGALSAAKSEGAEGAREPSVEDEISALPRLTGKSARSTPSAVAQNAAAAAAASAGKKRQREEQHEFGEKRPRVPKFGETNDAPPTLKVSGQLSKKVAAAHGVDAAAQVKTDALARQRQSAMEAYAKAKAARRAEAQL